MKKKAIIATLLILMMLLVGIITPLSNISVQADNTAPRLTYKIISNSSNPTIDRGSSFEADFIFTDDSNILSSSVDISVKSPNGSIVNLPTNSINIGVEHDDNDDKDKYILNLTEKNMRYVGKGDAILRFVLKDGDKTYTFQKTITECHPTETSSATNHSVLSLLSYKADRDNIKEGERFHLNLTLINNDDITNNHITAVISGLNPDEITMDGKTDTYTIATINSGATASISLPMICHSKMVSKNYMLKVDISSDESPSTSSYNIFVPVTGTKSATESGSDSPTSSKPLIIIENYDYGGKAVMGGKEFNLAMRFKNTSTATQIENLKITISSVAGGDDKSVAGAFTPAKSSNTFFIPKVGPNSGFSEQIALIPKADATPNSYGVTVAFSYEAVLNNKRETIEATETISIPLTQSDRFEANEAELQGPIALGDSGQLNINYVNKGKSKIFNLSVKLEGNFTTGESNTYIGNVDSGVGDTFQATLNPTAEGTMTGKATFSYEDANGEIKNLVKEFSCEVIAAMDQSGGMSSEPAVPANAGASSPPLWIILAGAGGVIAAIIVFVIIHKKRKAKKLKLLEESDDYDDTPANPAPPSDEGKL